VSSRVVGRDSLHLYLKAIRNQRYSCSYQNLAEVSNPRTAPNGYACESNLLTRCSEGIRRYCNRLNSYVLHSRVTPVSQYVGEAFASCLLLVCCRHLKHTKTNRNHQITREERGVHKTILGGCLG